MVFTNIYFCFDLLAVTPKSLSCIWCFVHNTSFEIYFSYFIGKYSQDGIYRDARSMYKNLVSYLSEGHKTLCKRQKVFVKIANV